MLQAITLPSHQHHRQELVAGGASTKSLSLSLTPCLMRLSTLTAVKTQTASHAWTLSGASEPAAAPLAPEPAVCQA